MERDNLTEALNRWTEKGVSNKDLSAPTLYRDLMAEWLDSDSMMDISTNATQMIQGYLLLIHICLKMCHSTMLENVFFNAGVDFYRL